MKVLHENLHASRHWKLVYIERKVSNSNRQERKTLKRRKLSEKQIESYKVNQRVMKSLVNVLPDEVLCHVGNYKDSKDSWGTFMKIHTQMEKTKSKYNFFLLSSTDIIPYNFWCMDEDRKKFSKLVIFWRLINNREIFLSNFLCQKNYKISFKWNLTIVLSQPKTGCYDC